MPAHDLALLTEAARAAGEVALRYWKNAPKAWDKADTSPVTEADLACNDLIQGILRRARPGYGWLSEETPDDTARLQTECQFIIDPIDGTRAFIAGEKHFHIRWRRITARSPPPWSTCLRSTSSIPRRTPARPCVMASRSSAAGKPWQKPLTS